jgi:hypothetical protein
LDSLLCISYYFHSLLYNDTCWLAHISFALLNGLSVARDGFSFLGQEWQDLGCCLCDPVESSKWFFLSLASALIPASENNPSSCMQIWRLLTSGSFD